MATLKEVGIRIICVFFICALAVLPLGLGIAPAEARDWADKPLVVVHSDNTPPLSSMGLNKEPKGLVIDYWRAWSAKNGIPVTFVLTDWPGTLQMIRDGKADVHGGLYFNEERDEFLDFASPFFEMEAALFVRKGLGIQYVAGLGNRPVGVLEKGFSEFYLRKNYPELNLLPFKTSRHMAQAAVGGDVDALLTEYTTLIHQLGAVAKVDDFIPLKTLYAHSLRPAVAAGNEELLNIIEEGEAKLSSRDFERIFSRWTVAKPLFNSWVLPAVGLGALFTGVLACLFFNLKRRRQ